MLYNRPTTIREVNRYLNPVVRQLLEKHKKSTNPDFEKELRVITGIGWKQVKNYRNHPNPAKEIDNNSKIQQFIYQQRTFDYWYKTKTFLYYILTFTLLLLILTFLIIGIYKSFYSTQKQLKEVIDNRIQVQLKNNPFKGCTKSVKEVIRCSEGEYLFKNK